MKGGLARDTDFDNRAYNRQFACERDLKRDIWLGELLPGSPITNVKDRIWRNARQREEFMAGSLIITRIFVPGFPNRFRIETLEFSVRKQNFAIVKADVFGGGRIRDIKIGVTLAFGREDLNELFVFGRKGRVRCDEVSKSAANDDRVIIRVITGGNTAQVVECAGQFDGFGGGCIGRIWSWRGIVLLN